RADRRSHFCSRATCSGTSHTEGLTKTFIATVVTAAILRKKSTFLDLTDVSVVICLNLRKIAGFQ
ncbi:MAG: hypothetical protein KID09_20590, partial [Paenibacillus macerans]|uniref:hypothetical protein n=1 Tax=Paenibacillus macerans TaxID=44252 RepID=UPI00242A9848